MRPFDAERCSSNIRISRLPSKIPAEALPWQISLHMNCIMFSGKQSSAGIAFYASRSRLKISLKTLRTKGWMKNSCVK